MPKLEKKPNGRPPHEPTDQLRMQVGMMAAAGLQRYHIAQLMGIHMETFKKHYADDYELGLARMTSQLATRIYKKALSNEPDARQAAEFLLKTRAGWGEKKSLEVTGPDGQPLIPVQEVDVASLPKDARNALKFALLAAKEASQAKGGDEITDVETEPEMETQDE